MFFRIKDQGRVTARCCPRCGHHEIGYLGEDNEFHAFLPGDYIRLLSAETDVPTAVSEDIDLTNQGDPQILNLLD